MLTAEISLADVIPEDLSALCASRVQGALAGTEDRRSPKRCSRRRFQGGAACRSETDQPGRARCPGCDRPGSATGIPTCLRREASVRRTRSHRRAGRTHVAPQTAGRGVEELSRSSGADIASRWGSTSSRQNSRRPHSFPSCATCRTALREGRAGLALEVAEQAGVAAERTGMAMAQVGDPATCGGLMALDRPGAARATGPRPSGHTWTPHQGPAAAIGPGSPWQRDSFGMLVRCTVRCHEFPGDARPTRHVDAAQQQENSSASRAIPKPPLVPSGCGSTRAATPPRRSVGWWEWSRAGSRGNPRGTGP